MRINTVWINRNWLAKQTLCNEFIRYSGNIYLQQFHFFAALNVCLPFHRPGWAVWTSFILKWHLSFVFPQHSRIVEGKEKDDPKTVPLKIFAKDIGNCAYVRASSFLFIASISTKINIVSIVWSVTKWVINDLARSHLCNIQATRHFHKMFPPGQDACGQQQWQHHRCHPHGSAAVWHISE